jgi:ABC-type phosphate transport system auxiliary subunit
MWKVFAIASAVLLVIAVVFVFMFFSGERERSDLRKRNSVLEKQSLESRRIAIENLRRLDGLEADNRRLSGNLEQLRTDNKRLAENNRTIRAELDRYTGWIADYFGTTGNPP